jgi:hypothetical protein
MKGKLIGLGVLALIAGLIVRSCYFTPEARVKRALSKAIAALEEQNLDGVLAFIHPEFSDSLGLDRGAWTVILQATWARWKDIKVKLLQPKIAVSGRHAKVSFHAMVDATLASSMKPGQVPDRETFGRQNVELSLVEDGGVWRMTGVGDLTPSEWRMDLNQLGIGHAQTP